MTAQEAIEIITNTPLYRYESNRLNGAVSELYHALVMSVHALEKQIPKKVKSPIRREAYSDCPICGIEVEMPWCYCYKCGQKLDWGE